MCHLHVHANHCRVVQPSKWDQNGRISAQILPNGCGPLINLLQNDH